MARRKLPPNIIFPSQPSLLTKGFPSADFGSVVFTADATAAVASGTVKHAMFFSLSLTVSCK
jgi:hypothetical protein